MSCVLGVIARPEAEVESKSDQVRDVMYFGIGVSCRYVHDGLEYANGGGFLHLERWFIYKIGFKLMADTPVH